MSIITFIQWCISTASPWIGCTEDNDECAQCYAKALDKQRFSKTMGEGTKANPISHWGKGAPRYRCVGFEDSMRALNRKAAAKGEQWRVFPSLCDIFDEEVPDSWRDDYFEIVEETPALTHIILTKRAEKMHRYMTARYGATPLPHVWLLVSAGRQATLDAKVPWLLKTAAAIRGVSCEPMLEKVMFNKFIHWSHSKDEYGIKDSQGEGEIDWVIFGGESKQHGKNPRPCDAQWIRWGVTQFLGTGGKVYVKQLGSNVVSRNDVGFEGEGPTEWPMDTDTEDIDSGYQGAPVRVLLRDPKGGDPVEWPEDLRVREFPV